MWLKDLKIAVIEKDTKCLAELMNKVPTLNKPTEINEAISLINEAKKIIISLKNDTQTSMIQMKKNIDFLKVTEDISTSKLDIIS